MNFKQISFKIMSKMLIILFFVSIGHAGAQTVFTHSKGTTSVADNPKRVVVFDMGTLETYHELGIPVVGVPNNIPEYLADYRSEKYVKAGSLKEPNLAAVRKLQPDLIIISSRQAAAYDSLSAIAPTIFVGIDANEPWKSFEKNVRQIAKLHGKEKAAEKKLLELNKMVANVRKLSATGTEKVLTVLYVNNRFVANGEHSRFGFAYDILGLKSAYQDTSATPKPGTPRAAPAEGKSKAQEPYIAKLNPDYILIIDRNAATTHEASGLNKVVNDDIKQSAAFKNNKVFLLHSDAWYLSGGGLLSTKLQITDIGKYVYGLFN